MNRKTFMKRAPSEYTLLALVNEANYGCKAEIDGKWVPARPLGLDTLRSRLRAAWWAFTGKADVVIWPGGQ